MSLDFDKGRESGVGHGYKKVYGVTKDELVLLKSTLLEDFRLIGTTYAYIM